MFTHEVLRQLNYSDMQTKKMTECFREAATSLGYASLQPEQEKVLSKLFEGEYGIVSLPTEFGS